jgi:hypothetical protein
VKKWLLSSLILTACGGSSPTPGGADSGTRPDASNVPEDGGAELDASSVREDGGADLDGSSTREDGGADSSAFMPDASTVTDAGPADGCADTDFVCLCMAWATRGTDLSCPDDFPASVYFESCRTDNGCDAERLAEMLCKARQPDEAYSCSSVGPFQTSGCDAETESLRICYAGNR